MYSPQYYRGYIQQPITYAQPYYSSGQPNSYVQPIEQNGTVRQPPQMQGLERLINQLTAQNEKQAKEMTRQNNEIRRLNGEIARINEEINRMNEELVRLYRNDELHTSRLNRLNQRLRQVERSLNIPITPTNDGF